MSIEYDRYLRDHKTNVMKAYYWLKSIFPFKVKEYIVAFENIQLQMEQHDDSKYREIEYVPYDNYFYKNKWSRSSFVVNEFHEAFLMHLHANPHHWQHWVLIPDSSGEPQKAIFMPYNYVIEMVCDWFSFSLASGNIDEIFDFYLERKDHIVMHPKSRQFLEALLNEMEKIINEKDETGKYTCNLWSEYPRKDQDLL